MSNAPAQSTSCCSESRGARQASCLSARWLSRAPTVEKVQQLPQWPWFFTSETTPRDRQSSDAGRSAAPAPAPTPPVAEHSCGSMSTAASNSSCAMSLNWFRPIRQESSLALCASTRRFDARKCRSRSACSAADA